MESKSKIPALALLGLSFTQCTARQQPADPIIGDWRAIQVDGEKRPRSIPLYGGESFLVGEQLRIDDDLDGEMARYQRADYDGLDYESELIADLVVDASAAPKYRIDVVHDFFERYQDPDEPYDPDIPPGAETGQADTGYADSGDYAELDDDAFAELRPLTVPTSTALAPAAMTFHCTLEGDTLTCEREGATDFKQWVFARVDPEET